VPTSRASRPRPRSPPRGPARRRPARASISADFADSGDSSEPTSPPCPPWPAPEASLGILWILRESREDSSHRIHENPTRPGNENPTPRAKSGALTRRARVMMTCGLRKLRAPRPCQELVVRDAAGAVPRSRNIGGRRRHRTGADFRAAAGRARRTRSRAAYRRAVVDRPPRRTVPGNTERGHGTSRIPRLNHRGLCLDLSEQRRRTHRYFTRLHQLAALVSGDA
jgi:hypothetical protein